jgi:hypothetical protein
MMPHRLKVKNILDLFGYQIVYLMRKDNICHLLCRVRDWSEEIEEKFGQVIAIFSPYHAAGPGWYLAGEKRRPISHTKMLALIGTAEICFLGFDCQGHQRKDRGCKSG